MSLDLWVRSKVKKQSKKARDIWSLNLNKYQRAKVEANILCLAYHL